MTMLVDTQPPPSSSSASSSTSFTPTFPSSFEDFFNMDLVSSSRSSSSSPNSPPLANSFPYTPPQQAPLQSFFPYDSPSFSGTGLGMDITGFGSAAAAAATGSTDPSEFLNMYLDDDFSKPLMMMPPAPPSSAGGTPYDFLGAFSALTSSVASSSSSSAAGDSPLDNASPQQMVGGTIDPQLVGTPSTGRAMSEFEDEHREEDDDEDNEDEDDISTSVPRSAASTVAAAPQVIAPVKVGGKGKARKGTVASGGINKKSSSITSTSSVVASGKENAGNGGSKDGGRAEDKDSDDWRPSPEEYKKMSSKEKRQLRNKISARNFRVRRKEYISTLEADISERDALISAIRSELGSSKSENVALRQEIAALKKALLTGRGVGETPVLPPPAPLPVSTAAATSTLSAPRAPSPAATTSPLITPNTQKDLPMSPRLGVRGGFWGGAIGGGTPGIGGGGYTPVHTTFVPPMPLPLGLGVGVGATSATAARLSRKNNPTQENINPSLNRVPSPPIIDPSPFAKAAAKKNLNNSADANGNGLSASGRMNISGAGVGAGPVGFDAFMDMNPFTLKTLDAYRMQLWGRMAAQTHQYQQQQQQQQLHHQQQHQLTGLAERLRPHYFRDAHGFSALSGKAAAAAGSSHTAYPTPPASPSLGATKDWREKEKEQREAMYVAAIASQTLLSKLGSAFWDAFSGSNSTSSISSSGSNSSAFTSTSTSSHSGGVWKQWDADKVRKVLEGKAVVRVVDVESPTSSPKISPQASPKIPASPSPSTSSSGSGSGNGSPACSERCRYVTDILEESMRSLSLGKK